MKTAESYNNILHERYFRLTLLTLLFAYPVSTFITDAVGIQSNLLSVLSRAFQVCAVILYTFFLIRTRRFKIYNYWLYVFILFWIIYGIRVIYDISNYGNMLGIEPKLYYMFGFVICFLLTIPLFVPAPIDDEKLEKWLYWIVFGCTLAILNGFLRSNVVFVYRVNANEKLNAISAAYPSGILLVLAFRRILYKKRRLWIHIPLNIIMIGIALYNLAIASTKSVYIFSILLIVVMIGKLATSGKIKKILLASSIIVLVTSIVVIYFSDYFMLSVSRFTEVDNSSDERLIYINGAINQFLESPLLGSFIEEKSMKFYPHNPVLESFMALGIIGGSIFLCYFLNYAIKTTAMVIKGQLLTITILSFSVLVVHFVSGSLSFSFEMWYFTAIFSALPPLKYMVKINPGQPLSGAVSKQGAAS